MYNARGSKAGELFLIHEPVPLGLARRPTSGLPDCHNTPSTAGRSSSIISLFNWEEEALHLHHSCLYHHLELSLVFWQSSAHPL